MMESIKVHAPATVANVVCGFDVMGFAVEAPGDEVTLTLKDEPGIRIKSIRGDGGKLPLNPTENTVSVAIAKMMEATGFSRGVEIELEKKMPLGSGLGSSAASAAAGVFAFNQLIERPMNSADLVPFAMEGERLACGTAHADNVAPAIMGGFILIRQYDPLDLISLPYPTDLFCVIVHPHIEINTRDAREILRKNVPLKLAAKQWGNVAGLVSGLYQHDYDLMSRSLVDVIVEPVRSILIPGFERVKSASKSAGAIGCGISGSGPSIFALCREGVKDDVSNAMKKVYKEMGIGCDMFTSPINATGPKILEK